jgi:Tol biopolymer transport system component/predicted Ser/Thr protein kinase
MPLSAQTRLGPYEILALIGAGGMGEVYKARDERLDRIVAVKVSNEKFSERFGREARAVAALNHPHICTLHDVGPNYLVMEYIEGQPLKGPLPFDQVLKYAIQICDALDAAHQKGITHRDLKPANILLIKSGVKLLDFGLAKIQPAVATEETITATLTGKGYIIGTLQYMSPEQLQGRNADARSDIFSFGLVLYEMLTGKRAFEGSSPASVIGAILEREAPSVADVAPQALDRTLRRCLEKDPENRWQSARDLRFELEWIAAGDFAEPRAVPRRALLPWMAGAAVAGAAGGAGIAMFAWRGDNSPPTARAIRFQLAPLEGAWLERGVIRQSLALSPVGGRVAMIATNERRSMIWVQRLDSLTATPLQGTEGAYSMFWSPDGQFIGFWADGKIKKIPAEGGTPLAICDFPAIIPSGSWSRDGIIITRSSSISVQSGEVRPMSPAKFLTWPKFLPDGKHVLQFSRDPKSDVGRAYIADLSTGRDVELMPTDTQVIFVPDHVGAGSGYLLFGRGGSLLALRFDADRLRVTGEPVPVAKEIPFLRASGWSEFDASADGILIYSTGPQKAQLIWLDRTGHELGAVGEPQDYWGSFRLSPDGKRLAADIFDFNNGSIHIWVYDFSQATSERITFGPASNNSPIWSPDGKDIAFDSSVDAPGPRLRVKAVSDHGSGEGFPQSDTIQLTTDWSSDGRWIFYQTSVTQVNSQIWLASAADRKIMPLLQTRFDNVSPALSPNREYLAFCANDTGRHEIYVQRFQEGDPPKLVGDRRRVSRNGGTFPQWRRDGKELFFLSPDRHLMAVAVKPGTEIEIGPPATLFQLPTSFRSRANEVWPGYEVSLDGQKFLAPIRKAANPPLQVVVNWQAELKH